MFDIGLPEIAITGVVALVVLGPKELPGLLRLAGQLTRKAKNMAHEFRISLDEMVEVDELEEFRKEAWKKATQEKSPTSAQAQPLSPTSLSHTDSQHEPESLSQENVVNSSTAEPVPHADRKGPDV